MVVGGREWWGREWGDGLLAHCGHHGRGEFVWVSLDLDLEDGNGGKWSYWVFPMEMEECVGIMEGTHFSLLFFTPSPMSNR